MSDLKTVISDWFDDNFGEEELNCLKDNGLIKQQYGFALSCKATLEVEIKALVDELVWKAITTLTEREHYLESTLINLLKAIETNEDTLKEAKVEAYEILGGKV
jgi:hypothetical protein